MERLRQIVSQIAARMGVLSVSQRVALGLCAALVAFSLLWLMQWSTAPELVPLVNQEFHFDSLDAAEAALRTNGIPFQIAGTRIFVSPADRHNALRVVHSANALPEGSLFDMSAVIKEANPFQSPEAREYAQNYAMGNELAKIISTYPFVRKASVLINPKSRRRLGVPGDVPTASVAVSLAPGADMAPEMVEGFAKLVAGSVAGLKPHNVNIMDSRTGRSFSVPHPDDALSFDYLGMVKNREAHLLAKIMAQLADIPGVRAQVTVELDTSKRVVQKQSHDEPQPKTESSQSTDSSTAAPAGEPGVQANLGTAISAAGNGQSQTSEETKVENFEPRLRETETVEHLPMATKNVTATVSIPRSFIVGLFAARNPDAESPTDDDPGFTAIREAELTRVRTAVERIVMARDPRDVQVDVYPDMKWTSGGGEWMPPGEALAIGDARADMDAMNMLRDYGPAAGLGTLALLSLFMMMRIVRHSTDAVTSSARTLSAANSGGAEPVLTVGPSTIGQAAVSESFLTGHEVDEKTLRYQELGQEVAKMVEEDPRAAAELLRRWVQESA